MTALRIDIGLAAAAKRLDPQSSATPSPPRSRPLRSPTVGASSQNLVAVDLARDRARPLHVPPMRTQRAGESTLDSLTRIAKPIAPGILVDEDHNFYALSETLAHGTFGNIRLGLKHDAVISQVWIFKEIARPGPAGAQRFAQQQATPLTRRALSSSKLADLPKSRLATPAICEGLEESLKYEVDLMHKAQSPLAPHAVLRTKDRAYVMLPLADTDLFSAWSDMVVNRWSAQQRQPVVLSVARQVLQQLCDLHDSGIAHRDIKPANIFLTREGETFLGDYGMAVPQAQKDVNVGTYQYLAPEALLANHDKFKNDIFGVGSLLTSLLIDTGYLWKNLWDKHELVADLRGPDCSNKSIKMFGNLVSSYQLAHKTPAVAARTASLRADPTAQKIHKLMVQTKDAYPGLYPLLRKMQSPDPNKRPSAQQALTEVMNAELNPSNNERAELRHLISSGDRPIRAAADKQALKLEAKLVGMLKARQLPRRHSVGNLG